MTANSEQLKVLRQHFPGCFDRDGAFLPRKLQSLVKEKGGQVSTESYTLNWLGKSYARLLANETPRTLLQADAAHNTQPEHATSQNLLIQGDNLEVLKHLKGAYSRQVKMIYIDPPYNTGSDGFVYADDRKFTPTQLSHLAGINEDEAKRVLDFTSSKSNSHSAWLTFMYPRLYIARELLRDDGVIFIQIDDNEQAQLKLLCDEVFGEENFVSQVCVKMSHLSGVKMSHKDKKPAKIKEFILIYTKQISQIKLNPVYIQGEWGDVFDRYDWYVEKSSQNCEQWEISNLNNLLKSRSVLTEKDVGDFRLSNAESIFRTAPNTALNSTNRNLFFEKITTATGLEKYTYKGEEVLFAESKLQIIDGKLVPANLVGDMWNDIGINNLHKEGEVPFPNGKKPLKLLNRVLKMCSDNDETSNIILDFFAGSGTTAHAVMQLNAEDGGKRQFICVQLDEATDTKSEARKAGYQTIFDISRARISKAAAKIRTEHPDYAGDLGFKVFQTVPVFEGYLDEPEELSSNLELFSADTLTEQDRLNLLLTWAVQDGIALTKGLTPVELAGYTAYQGGEAGRLLYFIHPQLSLTVVIELLRRLDDDAGFAPKHLIVWGYGLDSKAQREMTEAVAHYTNRKNIELDMEVRF